MLDPLAAADVLADEAAVLPAGAAAEVEVEAAGAELDEDVEQPAASTAAAAMATPPAAMRAGLSVGIRTAAFAAAHEPTSLAMCVAPLQSPTVPKSISAGLPCGERTPQFPAVKITIRALYSLKNSYYKSD